MGDAHPPEDGQPPIDDEGGQRRSDRVMADDQIPEGPGLSTSEIFEILYNRRRREILSYLRSTDGPVTRSTLAEHLAAEETDQTVSEVSSYDRKRMYIGLYQTHLPMLAEKGVIAYDEDRGTIELRDAADQLAPYLDRSPSWPPVQYDLVVAGAIAILVVLGVSGVGVFGAVAPEAWAVAGLVGLVVLVLLRTVRDYAL